MALWKILEIILIPNYIFMNLKEIKKLVELWVKWSWQKQLKVFTQNKKTTRLFEDILKWSSVK